MAKNPLLFKKFKPNNYCLFPHYTYLPRVNEAVQLAIRPLQEQIKNLKSKIEKINTEQLVMSDSQEQYSRRNNVRIFGVPESPREKIDEVVKKLAGE